MLATVDLDYEFLCETDKIQNEPFDGNLPAKFKSHETTMPQQPPHCSFGIGRFATHISREFTIAPSDRSVV
jgi:hypothetical protein